MEFDNSRMVKAGQYATLNKYFFYSAFTNESMNQHFFEGIAAFLFVCDALFKSLVLELDLKNGPVGTITHFSASGKVFSIKLAFLTLIYAFSMSPLWNSNLFEMVRRNLRLFRLRLRMQLKFLRHRLLDHTIASLGLLLAWETELWFQLISFCLNRAVSCRSNFLWIQTDGKWLWWLDLDSLV